MSDQEETLVFNYIVEEQETPKDSCGKQDGSFDENQNSKRKSTRNSSKSPPRKRNNSNQSYKKKKLSRTPSATAKISKKKSQENGSIQKNWNCDNVTVKIETVDDDIPETNNAQTTLNTPDGETVEIKREPIETDTQLKSESHSEAEENTKKRKQSINNLMKLKNSPSKDSNGEPPLETTKVVDLKSHCKMPVKTIFKCNQCLYVGNSKANLERHTLIHMDPNDILWYKCMDCDYKSKYESQLKSHSLIHKNPDEIQYFQCPHCELKCIRKHNLNHHIKSIHADRVNNLQCAECSYTTFSKERLVAHLKMHSKEVFMCHLCKFVTKRKEYLENHIKIKHTEVDRPFPCDTCSYKGKTRRELDRHYNRMHNKEQLRVYQCNHCEFNSIYKKNLEFHLLHMHQNSKGFQKFICGHCEKEFAYKNGLKTHIVRIHLKLTDEDWHKCQECEYKCKDVNTLKRHIKRNHGAPRLNCKQCSFATNRQKSMIAHMKTHEVSEDQILKCSECPYRIIQSVSFLYHMKVVHGKPISTKDVNKYYVKKE
ncbi:hypothetical protein ABEB36_007039 [Hypothenemus hampei]|uniref:C2H2-type domain-containing protein n=1 Tax=Hypothenemus hampei TaxID=57062 RepID=A0ABD1ESN9_HYPHA